MCPFEQAWGSPSPLGREDHAAEHSLSKSNALTMGFGFAKTLLRYQLGAGLKRQLDFGVAKNSESTRIALCRVKQCVEKPIGMMGW